MVFAVSFSGMLLNHDCALLLQCGRLISEGSIPYVDHVETNLHMAQYIHVPPVLLSNVLGINVSIVFAMGVLLVTFYSCFTVFLLVRRSGLPTPGRELFPARSFHLLEHGRVSEGYRYLL